MFHALFAKFINCHSIHRTQSLPSNDLIIRFKQYSRICKLSPGMKKNQPGEFEIFFPKINPNGIHNKVALVFGGSTGVGFDCVKQLLDNGVKAVMIADRDETRGRKLVNTLGREYGPTKISFIKTDVTNAILLRHAYCSTLDHLEGLDIVVNDHKHSEENDWERQIDRSIKGIVRNTLLALEYMGTHNGGKGGVMVNVVKPCEQKLSKDGLPLFVGAQHFTMGFNRSLAMQYFKGTGVKVLSLAPEIIVDAKCEPKYDLVKLLSKANCGAAWT